MQPSLSPQVSQGTRKMTQQVKEKLRRDLISILSIVIATVIVFIGWIRADSARVQELVDLKTEVQVNNTAVNSRLDGLQDKMDQILLVLSQTKVGH